jgi:hypothetical protein
MSICSRSTFHTSAKIWTLLTEMDMTDNDESPTTTLFRPITNTLIIDFALMNSAFIAAKKCDIPPKEGGMPSVLY